MLHSHTLSAAALALLIAVGAEGKETCDGGACVEPSSTNGTSFLQFQQKLGKTPHGNEQHTPSAPEVCSPANQGRCECGSGEVTTYTWWVDDVQRCASIYVPADAQLPVPVMLFSQCYGKDKLVSFKGEREHLARFGFAGVYLSTPEGAWITPDDGVVNHASPQPCSRDAGGDIAYVTDVLDFIAADPTTFDNAKIYTYGFSQNSMFSAFIGFCFSEKIAGIGQSGSGLWIKGGRPLPGRQGECKFSDKEKYGNDCKKVAPCNECEYFPIYPCHTQSHSLAYCALVYDNDYLKDTHQPMYDAAVAEGYDSRLMTFPVPSSGGGHSFPENYFDWFVGCFGITQACSSECEQNLKACVGTSSYSDCMEDQESLSCAAGCSPTKEMLTLSEKPEFQLSEGTFGPPVPPKAAPPGSLCTHVPAGGPSPDPGAPEPTPAPDPGTVTPAPDPTPDPDPTPAPDPDPTPDPTPQPAQQDPCTADCEQEFLNGCMPFHKSRETAEKAYSTCRSQIDKGFWRLKNKGCIPGCASTDDMLAAGS